MGILPDNYMINDIDRLDTPALVVYPALVKSNIELAISMAGGAGRLRPHVKTHKSPEATRLLLDAGIRQFKCATIAEAEMLAMTGAADVLLAYQPLGPKAERLVALIKKYPATRFSCLIDNEVAADSMSNLFSAAGLRVPVFLDIDLGMNRTGIAPGDGAHSLYRSALQSEGLDPIGLHAYDGHIRDTEINERTRKCDAAFLAVKALSKSLGDVNIIAGGSPTFPIHCLRGDVQCSPGTFIYWDKGYMETCAEQAFKPAALVLTRVISQSGTRITLDLGHKSIAPENTIDRRVSLVNSLQRPGPAKFVSQSEEHLVVDAGPDHSYKVGDVFYGIPYHICPTVALYERAFTVDDGHISGEWHNIARDRRLTV